MSISVTVFADGKAVNEILEDGSRELSIGRSPGCVVHLDDPAVSRLHAVIKKEGTDWVIERKSSFGPLSINGEELENAVLQGGEEIIVQNFILRINVMESESEANEANPFRDSPTNATVGVNAPTMKDPDMDEPDDSGTKTNMMVAAEAVGYFRFKPGVATISEYVIEKDLIVIGRAKNCDIVLLDKKSSRKHLEIRKQGLSFYLKDLNTANGTLVNDKETQECELIPGDVILAGEAKFEFTIENKNYFAEKENYLAVPSEAMENVPNVHVANSAPAVADDLASINNANSNQSGQAAAQKEEPEEKSLFKKWKKAYWALPKRQRYIVLALIAVLSVVVFNNAEEESSSKKASIKRDKSGKKIATYAALSPKKKKFVRETYNKVLKANEKNDYVTMQDELTKIFRLAQDYRDTKEYQRIASEGIEREEKLAEEKRKQRLKKQLKAEELALVKKGEKLFKEAIKNPDKRPEVELMAQQVFAKNPNNVRAQQWLKKIEEIKIAEERQKRLEAERAKLKAKAEQRMKIVRATFEKKKYLEALRLADKLKEIGYSEEDYLQRIETLKDEINAELSSKTDPLIRDAQEQRKSGGDLVKSKSLYKQVLEINPEDERAINGLADIRGVLFLRAKRLYANAMIAESLSVIDEAKTNLEQCLKVAPEDSIYLSRCQRKLKKYESFEMSPQQ